MNRFLIALSLFLVGILSGCGSGSPSASATVPPTTDQVIEGNLIIKGPSPWIDVRAFGATANGTADDTVAIQAAIDYGQTFVQNSTYAPIVYFPPGEYRISSTILWKSAHLVGSFPNTSVRIFWDGGAGGIAIQKTGSYIGGGSFAKMSGINFREGTGTPATWVSVENTADKYFLMDQIHFGSSTGNALVFTEGWINLHLTNLRWDNIGGYALHLKSHTTQNLSSFCLDRFTYDHSLTTNPGSGFLLVENLNGSANLGTVRVTNGRIEVNQPWSGNQAIVAIKHTSTDVTRSVGLHLSDITYQDSGSTPSDVLLYREFSTPPVTGSEQFLFENLRMENLSRVLGGGWPTWFPNPEVPPAGLMTQMSSQGAHMILAAPQEFLMADGTNMNPEILTSRENWLAASQFIVDVDGKMYWGNGNGATDIDVERTAVGELTFTGDLVADSFNPTSSREKKTDIDRLTESECREILEKIERTDLYSYRFKKDPSSGKKRLGVIAEESPEEILAPGGKALSLAEYCAFLLAGVKALREENRIIREEVRILKEGLRHSK